MARERCSTKVLASIKGKRNKSLCESAMWGGKQRHIDGELFVEVGEYYHPLSIDETYSMRELAQGYREDGHKVRIVKRCR